MQEEFAEAKRAVEAGAKAVMFSAGPAGDKSPGHPDLDPFWQYLEDNKIPFMLHIGPGTKTQPAKFKNNGRERAADLHTWRRVTSSYVKLSQVKSEVT